MMRLPRWKVILCLAALVYGLAFTLPNLLPDKVLATVPSWLPHQRLNLGLDLRGGSYLLYEVNTTELRTEHLSNLTEDARTTLQAKHIAFTELTNAGGVVSLRITDPTQIEAAVKELSNLGQALPSGGGRDVTIAAQPDQRIRMSISDQAMAQQAVQAVTQSIEIIRRRSGGPGRGWTVP